MSYPLRLPPELDAEVRERCQRLGISLNAFIAVAVDAYLHRGGGGAAARRGGGKPSKRPAPRLGKPAREPGQAFEGDGGDEGNWRFFHPDPDSWFLFDPQFRSDPIWERFGGEPTSEQWKLIEAEYWRTRERPAG